MLVHIFRVPLDGENLIPGDRFNRFGHAIVSAGDDFDARGNFFQPLVVARIDEGAVAHQIKEPAVGLNGEVVGREVARRILGVLDGGKRIFTQVLVEGAAQTGVDHLHPPADPKDRLAGFNRLFEQFNFKFISLAVGRPELLVGFFAKKGRIDVGATGKDHAVKKVQVIADHFRGDAGKDYRRPAGFDDCFDDRLGRKGRHPFVNNFGCFSEGIGRYCDSWPHNHRLLILNWLFLMKISRFYHFGKWGACCANQKTAALFCAVVLVTTGWSVKPTSPLDPMGLRHAVLGLERPAVPHSGTFC